MMDVRNSEIEEASEKGTILTTEYTLRKKISEK